MNFFNDINKSFFFSLVCLLSITVFSCNPDNVRSTNGEDASKDSISQWIQIAKDKSIEHARRLKFLRKAKSEVLLLEKDSLKAIKLFQITDEYYDLGEDSLFLLTNKVAYELAVITKNLKGQAEYHWNKAILFTDQDVLDSAFYHYNVARNLYKEINHEYYKAKMAYNMSFIQFRVNNYVESEILVISAIEGYKKLNRNLNLLLCYNRLLLLDKELGNFDQALSHYNMAISFLEKIEKKGIHKEKLLNNLSLVYQKQKQYQLAIEALNQALSNKTLAQDHPNLYAKLIDNLTYNRFLQGQNTGLIDDLNKALNIRDSLGNKAGVGISKMHLAEVSLRGGDSVKAGLQAQEAYEIATTLGLNRDILNSLSLLSKADPARATIYMDEYTKLNDSLLLAERKVRDKFTRIQFDTEGYIAANEDLKKKNVWISLTSLLTLATVSLLFFVYRQRSKNKTLVLEQQQQQANEEIYDLMLKQQHREEGGRIQERIRISEDLHDGPLARLFSIRIGLGFLKVKGKKGEKNRFNVYTKELQLVEKEIRNLSHALKSDDLSAKKDFPKLLSILMEERSSIGKFEYTFEQDSTIGWNQVDDKIKINLFKIVQEAICNIIKYAECQKVSLSVKREAQLVEIIIVDNGVGFDTNKKSKGIGLKNMKSRAKSIGADMSISSVVHKGTRIKISIPTKILYHEPTT